MRKFAVPLALTAILSVPVVYWVLNATYTPPIASEESVVVDRLLRLEFAIAGVIFVLCMVFFAYSLFAFRRQPDDMSDGQHFHSHNALEIAWTIVPAIIVLGLGVLGIQELRALNAAFVEPEPEDLVVEVTGMQWTWSFDYPDSGVSSSELVLPVNRPAYFKLEATDVIHSFWIPEMRLKMDAVPGKSNALRLVPNQPGQYKVRCAELCGTRHAYMESVVRVVSEADYEAWVREESAILAAPPPERGLAWARKYGCIGCHSADGSALIGPSWKGLIGSERRFSDGTTDLADADYIKSSILAPNDQVVEGFNAGVMPQDLADRMSEQEIDDLIAYIESLE